MKDLVTGKQIGERIKSLAVSEGAKNGQVSVVFLNRRGIKVFVSKSKVHEIYVRMPYVSNYSSLEEQKILSRIRNILQQDHPNFQKQTFFEKMKRVAFSLLGIR